MATKTETDRKIDVNLESLRLVLEDLPGLAWEWDCLGDGERTSWRRDWDQLMGALEGMLQSRYHSGGMTSDQQRRHRAVLRQLIAAAPTIERLGLYLPPVPLEA